MYEAYFGLRERPFSIVPDPRYLYLSPRHREALAHLLYGVRERGGFVQLTGEVGTGKTTLTRALLEQLPGDVDVALILNPALTVREFMLAVCQELAVELPQRGHSPAALIHALTRHLLARYARGRRTVVLVDEAQTLSASVLEQVRLLTNLETSSEKLLQIILVGQPELRSLLQRPELRQVAQRVTARFHLTPLTLSETRAYVRHRLWMAGSPRSLFSGAAVRAVHRRARGIPRLINIVCDRALLGAYAAGRRRISLRIGLRAAAEVEGREQRRPRRIGFISATAVLAAVALAAAPALDWQRLQEQPARLVEPLPQPQTAPTLMERIQQNDPQLDPRAALVQLFGLWGGRYRADSGQTACEQARQQGLRCDLDAAGWAALLSRNLPVVLELHGRHDGRHGVLLTGFEGADAIVSIDGGPARVAQTQIIKSWTGSSVALWRPPAAVTDVILPGSRGPAVAWLSRQLDRIDGRSTQPGAVNIYDADLRRRVLAFQRAHGLAVDGIVGDNTLLHLMLAAPEPDMPRLRN